MFFLGASLGHLAPVPTWLWFTLAVVTGVYMMLKFTLWIDEDDDAGT